MEKIATTITSGETFRTPGTLFYFLPSTLMAQSGQVFSQVLQAIHFSTSHLTTGKPK
jgi:hypothetical protein